MACGLCLGFAGTRLVGRHGSTHRRAVDNADATPAPALAKELIELQPDVIVTGSTSATAAPHRVTKTIPIVFGVVNDRVGEDFVEALSRPAWPQVDVAFW